MNYRRIIPNMCTASNLVFGMCSMLSTLHHDFFLASVFILCALVADGLDGRTARFFGVASEFGKEMDSLCDLGSFGVAPALLAYEFYLNTFGLLGCVVAIFFPNVICKLKKTLSVFEIVFSSIRISVLENYITACKSSCHFGNSCTASDLIVRSILCTCFEVELSEIYLRASVPYVIETILTDSTNYLVTKIAGSNVIKSPFEVIEVILIKTYFLYCIAILNIAPCKNRCCVSIGKCKFKMVTSIEPTTVYIVSTSAVFLDHRVFSP